MKKQWEKLGSREGVDLTTIAIIARAFYEEIWNFYGTKKELFFTVFENKVFTHYIGVNIQEFGRWLFKKYLNSPARVIKFYKDGLLWTKKFQEITSRIKKQIKINSPVSIYVNALDGLEKYFLEVVNRYYNVIPFIAIESWQGDLNKTINSLIEKRNLPDRSKIINSICKPWRKTALAEIQQELGKNTDIKTLVEKYQYLRSWSIVWHRPIDENWIENLVQENAVIKQEKMYSYGQLIQILKPNEGERHFLQLAPYVIFFKDWRDELRRNFIYLWNFLFQLIARRMNIKYQDLGYLTIAEIKKMLVKDKINHKLIAKRKKHICLVTADIKTLKIKIIDSKIPRKYLSIIKNFEKKSDT